MSDGEIASMDTFYMKSEIVNHTRRFEWSIVNFSKYPAMSSILGKEFKLAPDCPFKWVVEIVVSHETFRICIRRTDKIDHLFPISCTIRFQNSDGEIHEKVLNSIYVFDNINDLPENTEIWSSNRPAHSTLELPDFPIKLPDDELTIKCEIVVQNCCIVTEELSDARLNRNFPKDASQFHDLLEDLETMYFEKPMTDILLKVGSDFIPCHKFLLCCRSSVLKKILEEDPNVKKFGIITIEGMDPLVMDDFLEYLYINTFRGQSTEVLIGLYEVSVKYCMKGLQDKCSDRLAKNLSENSVCSTLELAEANNDLKLKEAALMFISENFYKLKDISEFVTFVANNPRLFFEIISNSLDKAFTSPKR